MTTHHYGDEFDFDRLNQAAHQIANIYRVLTGNDLVWKEKFGTIRYEFIVVPDQYESDRAAGIQMGAGLQHVPLHSEEFLFSVMLTVADYPDLASEILDDYLYNNQWDEINKHRNHKDAVL